MVTTIKVDKTIVEKENMQGVVDMLNGLALACYWEDEFQEGWRNKVIVNLIAGSSLVGLDPLEVFSIFVENDFINPSADDEDTYKRVDKVMDYSRRFCWDWLISPDEYVDKAHDENIPGCPIEFVIA